MIGKLFNKKKSNDGFYLAIDETETTPVAATVEVKPEPVAVATATVATTEKKAKTSKSKKTKASTVSVAATPQAIPQEEVPFWVVAMNKSTSKNSQQEETCFATSNLMPAPTSRRRPGPSMGGFLAMARQVRQ